MRARVVALLGILACALGLTLTVSDPAPDVALAGCEARPAAQLRDEADATAIGTVVAIESTQRWFGAQSSGDPETYWIEISQVFDGQVQELIEVEGSRGYGLDGAAEGRSYLLFLRGETPVFASDGCTSIPLPIQDSETRETVTGWEWTAPASGGAELPRARVPWATIGLSAVVVAMVLLLARDARARKRRATASRD